MTDLYRCDDCGARAPSQISERVLGSDPPEYVNRCRDCADKAKERA